MAINVLWLAKAFPYEDSFGGDLVYSRGLMQGLVENGVSLSVICFADVSSEIQSDEHGVTWVKVPLKNRSRALSAFSLLPSIAHRYSSERYNKTLRRTLLANKWSAVVVDSIAMGVLLPELARIKLPTIYLAHNDETLIRSQFARSARTGLRKIALLWDAKKAQALENEIGNRVDCIATITEQDSASFQERHSLTRTVVCSPGYSSAPTSLPKFGEERTRTIVLLGSLHWSVKQRNLERFLECAYQQCVNAGVSIRIVGDSPPQFQEKILGRFSKIDFRGKVSSFQEHLADCRIGLVIDELGGGFKLKILDYVFHGLPVAGLIHAMEGSHLRSDADFIGSDTLEGLTAQVLRTIDNFELLTSIRDSAYDKSRSRYSWKASASSLLNAVSLAGRW
ncbi:glycosyltransferase family 4 protein [Bradyrhizobium sp. CW9]|uniref:glycosyltransferase n=1 Tax=Bradyrhizobium sp. CW9 TaxID=2782689 RepID=UPI001FF6FE0E|nr:glycosyltransferase [Bradyrhizobium sp. CW9]MCK1328234.1 glycosyltransferase family 4 protein [Bradyrhizobium sp. CW9]